MEKSNYFDKKNGFSTGTDWLNNFKGAIIREDFSLIENLLKFELNFTKIKEIEEFKYLLKESFILSMKKRDNIKNMMEKVAKNIEFTKASITTSHHKFNKKF